MLRGEQRDPGRLGVACIRQAQQVRRHGRLWVRRSLKLSVSAGARQYAARRPSNRPGLFSPLYLAEAGPRRRCTRWVDDGLDARVVAGRDHHSAACMADAPYRHAGRGDAVQCHKRADCVVEVLGLLKRVGLVAGWPPEEP
jgi:hypothetical protein